MGRSNQYIKKIIFFGVLCVLISLGSCQNSGFKRQFQLQNIVGLWQSQGTIVFYEQWQMTDDSAFVGVSFSINGMDTLVLENMRIASEGQGLVYEATVPNQNKGRGIRFIQTESAADRLVFENLQHDYPNRISYIMINDSILTTIVENSKGNKQKKFELKKIKP
jgi:hypothetical protein